MTDAAAGPGSAPGPSSAPGEAGTGPSAEQPDGAEQEAEQPAGAEQEAEQPAEIKAVPLLEPRDGMPPLIVTGEALALATRSLAAGDGPVAVDAERASGFRYGHR